jgi:hypothetical protein
VVRIEATALLHRSRRFRADPVAGILPEDRSIAGQFARRIKLSWLAPDIGVNFRVSGTRLAASLIWVGAKPRETGGNSRRSPDDPGSPRFVGLVGARRSPGRTGLGPVFPANRDSTGNFFDSETF